MKYFAKWSVLKLQMLWHHGGCQIISDFYSWYLMGNIRTTPSKMRVISATLIHNTLRTKMNIISRSSQNYSAAKGLITWWFTYLCHVNVARLSLFLKSHHNKLTRLQTALMPTKEGSVKFSESYGDYYTLFHICVYNYLLYSVILW